MSGSSNGPSSPDAAREQARSDVANNRLPASTHGWHPNSSDAYNAELTRQRDQQNSNKSY